MSLNILQASERSYKSLIKNPSSPLPLPQRGSGRGLGEKVRAALTPSPFPALRERGDLVRKRGIVASRRIAPAPLLPPLPLPLGESGRGLGKGEGRPHPRPLSRPAGEGGSGAQTRYRCQPQDRPCSAHLSPFRSRSVGAEGGWGRR